ncbi:hypothetical protein XCR_2004 [Xanthomonas campestris pv. raphani 756C]|nr:hypothetical protein XCR_2004 [Xanthomonas campestris pv. raphani 756C]
MCSTALSNYDAAPAQPTPITACGPVRAQVIPPQSDATPCA